MSKDFFQITETENQGLSRAFAVSISHKLFDEKIDSELLQLGKEVKISGFRPGKVPLPVLRQRYRDNVMRDALNETVEAALQATIKKFDITPAMMPDIKVDDYKEGEDIKVNIALEIMPEVAEVDFAKLSVEKAQITVDDATIAAEMQTIARNYRDLEEKAGAAEAGDVVNIYFKGYINGEAFEGGEADNFDLELGSKQFIDGFEDQLIGLKAGDAKDVLVTFPTDYGKVEYAGKEAKFEVKIHKVQITKDAELNEELAKKIGFSDLEGLQSAVRNMMTDQHQNLMRDYLKKKLFDELEKLCDFDVPPKMLKLEADEIERQMQNSEEKMEREEIEKIAGRRVRLGIFLSKTAKAHKIVVSNDELNQALQARLAAYPNNQKQVIDFYRKNPDRVQALSGPILEEKTVDFILSKANIIEKPYSVEEFMKLEENELSDVKKVAAA